ncbi:protein MAINTENANCE OF MERISTEMS [Trifolium repens]|nr:protein MAINTENANCE OF MERISTEMS [Trifolium repens]
MEEDVGRTRLGRETRAHASAREAVAPRPKKARTRRQSPVPFQGSDYEAGGSSVGGSMPSQRPEGEVDHAAEGADHGAEGVDDENPPVDRDEDNEDPPVDEENVAEDEDGEDDGQAPVVPEEGYGGGPSDLSLLHEYHKHRANQIWECTNSEAPILKKVMRSVANGKKVINLPKLPRTRAYDWFWKAIEATETNTFHLPIGEVAITLDDIQCLLHLPITGRFLHHSRMRKDEAMDLLKRHLGVEEEIILLNFKTTKGCHIKYNQLQAIYVQNKDAALAAEKENKPMEEIVFYRERCIKAFLLYLVCCTIFSNKSQNYCDVVYLQYFEDLAEVGNWNWGAAALVYLKAYMAKSCKKLGKRTGLMAGYMSLLQGWVISHMPRMSVWKLATNWKETLPYNAKYEPGQGHRDQAAYREHLDNMQMSDFVYTPYTAHRQVRPLIDVCWFSGWLRCGGDTSTHLPERVLRQYGYIQTIPRPPAAAAPSGLAVDKIGQVFMEEMEERLIDQEMRGAAVENPWDHQLGYIAWYYKVSHPKMLRLEAHSKPPEPPHLEVLVEQQASQGVRDHFAICQNVRLELERAVSDGEALPGTPIYDTVQRCLSMVAPSVIYSRRRRPPGAPQYPYRRPPGRSATQFENMLVLNFDVAIAAFV